MTIYIKKDIVERTTHCGIIKEDRGIQSVTVSFADHEDGLKDRKELVSKIIDLVTEYSKKHLS